MASAAPLTTGAEATILAFGPDTPLTVSQRKTFLAPDGSFQIEIPARFTVAQVELAPGLTYFDFGADKQSADKQGGARLGILNAPLRDFAAPDALLHLLQKALAPTAKGRFEIGPIEEILFRGQKARFGRWSDSRNGEVQSGGWMEWSENGAKRGAAWSGGSYADAEVLRPLLDTLDFQPRPRAPSREQSWTAQQWGDELLKAMEASLGGMGAVNEDVQHRDLQAPALRERATPAEFEALNRARLAAPVNTLMRASAARAAARLAARLAWQASESGKDSAGATRFFALRAELESEAYDADSLALEAAVRASDAEIARWKSLTPPQSVAASYQIAFDGAVSLKAMRLNSWQLLALSMGRRATPTLEKSGRALFELRRTDLEKVRLVGEGQNAIWERQKSVASAFDDLGKAAQQKDDLEGARAYFARALEWRRAIADAPRPDIDESLRKRAVLEGEMGDSRLARDFYEQTLREYERVRPQREAQIEAETGEQLRELRRIEWVQSQAVTLSNLGVVTQNLGDYNGAETRLQKALALIETLPAQGLSNVYRALMRAKILGNLAVLRADTGELDKGETLLSQTAEIYRSIGNDGGLALALFNAASLDYERGDSAAAETKVQSARALFGQLQQATDVVSADVFLARMLRERGDFARALQIGVAALTVARTLNDQEWIGVAARGVANTRLEALGEAPLTPALRLEIGALIDEATRADDLAGMALSMINTLSLRARWLEKSGDDQGALQALQGAIARLERTRATTSSEAFSELKDNFVIYGRAVRLLLKLKRPEEAFDMLGRARSKKLGDTLRLSALKTTDPELQLLLDRLAGLEEKLAKTRARLISESAAPAPRRDNAVIANLEGLLASTQAQFFQVSEQIKARNPRFETTLSLSPLELRKAQRSLPEGALLLQYAALDDGLYIFAVTRRDLKIFQPTVSKADLQKQVRIYRAAISRDLIRTVAGQTAASIDAPSPLFEATQKLSQWLIEPVKSEIAEAKIVAIVPSGELFYLPFHALGNYEAGKWRFLIEQVPVAYLAAGDVLSVATGRDEANQGQGILALGDPVGADLPAARQEVEAIARLFPNSRASIGAQASKASILAGGGSDKRILHLAAHGFLDSARPDQSFIQLSPSPGVANQPADDGKLRLGEIRGLDLSRVDLVTLSACQTALGQGTPDGSEISSLAAGFSGAGTLSVVASLWNVEDQSTGHLMESFYGALADGEAKGIALQKAQIALLRNPKTRHPLFWAPFELLGDWR